MKERFPRRCFAEGTVVQRWRGCRKSSSGHEDYRNTEEPESTRQKYCGTVSRDLLQIKSRGSRLRNLERGNSEESSGKGLLRNADCDVWRKQVSVCQTVR